VKLAGDRRLFTGIIHDLSQQKQQEEQLRHYAAELERSNRELESFAYISSHDLQEPLRKIQAFGSRIIAREAANLSPQGKDYLERIQRASARLQNLINDLLAFSRVSSQARPFTLVNLQHVMGEVLSDLEITITEAQADIAVADLPTIEADSTQMRQLLQNLLSNAIKFGRQGEPPKIEIWSEQLPDATGAVVPQATNARYLISVRDQGIGFDEKYLDRIFNIFQRLEGRKFEGSGIGLAICRKIALRHGGDLTARSQPDQGALFMVTLPAKQPVPHASVADPSADDHAISRKP
jgi:light-regulated signal transduction histidine kinase (bacteriophytochrome)